MGISNSPDIFQSRINQLMDGLDYVRAYLDNILIVTKNTYGDHLNKLDTVLQRLHAANLKFNIGKSTFATMSFEYLGYYIMMSGIRPLTSKVDAIQQLKPPKTLKQLSSLLDLINYYRDMWKRRSHILTPLTELTKVTRGSILFKWDEVHEKAFQEIKKLMSKNTMVFFPDFNKVFEIHIDASDCQLCSVINQDNKPLLSIVKH
jgi:RNase H-like domain found in reverse transcriptase/Reverse transcriptase (RNA-dependent DNA polymerase)